jgi:hypothetical protein
VWDSQSVGLFDDLYAWESLIRVELKKINKYKEFNNVALGSTGLKQTIQMTKSPLTRHGTLLQTPMTQTLPRQSNL